LKGRSQKLREARVVAAQRAYLDALVEWERMLHQIVCPACRPDGVSDAEQARRCRRAEAEKERLRLIFRDLCDELGYVPEGHGIALPDEGQSCCRQVCH
jgi:hypothetical protein